MRTLSLSLLVLIAATVPVMAHCPPAEAGTTAAEIGQNQQRIVCLQRELTAETERRQVDIEIDMLSQRLRDLQQQQRFDLPEPYVPIFPSF